MNEERTGVIWYFEPPWYIDPLISNQEIGRGSKYHGFDIPLVGGLKMPWIGGRCTMGRGSEYHG